MNLYNDYCAFTGTTAIYPEQVAAEYLALGLCSEAAECVEVLQTCKCIPTISKMADIGDELGDVQWYTARLAYTYNLDFDYVVQSAKMRYNPTAFRLEDLLVALTVQAGLIAGKVKKQIRDGANWTGEQREEARTYIYDGLVQVVLLSMYATDWLHAHHGSEYGRYDNILIKNREKLESRKKRGVLQGDGSAR